MSAELVSAEPVAESTSSSKTSPEERNLFLFFHWNVSFVFSLVTNINLLLQSEPQRKNELPEWIKVEENASTHLWSTNANLLTDGITNFVFSFGSKDESRASTLLQFTHEIAAVTMVQNNHFIQEITKQVLQHSQEPDICSSPYLATLRILHNDEPLLPIGLLPLEENRIHLFN